MEKSDEGIPAIKLMAVHHSDQTTFPDLKRWEDAVGKKKAAIKAVNALKIYLQ